jgi:hypothetical protein
MEAREIRATHRPIHEKAEDLLLAQEDADREARDDEDEAVDQRSGSAPPEPGIKRDDGRLGGVMLI